MLSTTTLVSRKQRAMKASELYLEKSLLAFILMSITFLFQACNPNEDTGENLTPGDLLNPIDNSHDIYFLDNNTLYGVRDNNGPSTQGIGQIEQFMEVNIPSASTTITTPIALKISEDINNEAGGYGPIKMVVSSRDGVIYLYDIPGGNLIWQLDLAEEVRATPSYINVNDENGLNAYLFVGTASGTFYCINGANGSIIWSFEEPNGAAFESSTSSFNTGITCAATNTGTLYTWNLAGDLLWSSSTLLLMQSKPVLQEVSINNGLDYELESVLGGSIDGTVFRLNGSTGLEMWSRDIGAPMISAPFINFSELNTGSGHFYVGSLNGMVHQVSIDSGNIIWSAELDATIYSTPVENLTDQLTTNPTLYTNSHKTLYSLDILSGGTENWALPLDPPMYSTPNIVPSRNNGVGNRCYINTILGLYGINAETGELFSQFLTNGNQPIEGENSNFQSSPVIIYSESDAGTADIYSPKNVL